MKRGCKRKQAQELRRDFDKVNVRGYISFAGVFAGIVSFCDQDFSLMGHYILRGRLHKFMV